MLNTSKILRIFIATTMATSMSAGLMSCEPTEIEPTTANCLADTTSSPLYQSGVTKATTDNTNEYERGKKEGAAATTYISGEKDGKVAIYKKTYDEKYAAVYKKAYDPAYVIGYADPTASTKGKNDGLANGKSDGSKDGAVKGKADAEADAKYYANIYAKTPATSAGTNEGYYDGRDDGIAQGKSQGKSDGYNDGYKDGDYDGYKDGDEDGEAYCSSLVSNSSGARKTTNKRLIAECESVGYKITANLQGNYNSGYAAGSSDKTEYNKGYAAGYADGEQIRLANENGEKDGNLKGTNDGKQAGYNKKYYESYTPAYNSVYQINFDASNTAAYNSSYSAYYSSYYSSYYNYYFNLAYTSEYNYQLDIFFDQYYSSAYNDYYKPGYNDGYADGYDEGYYAWIDSNSCTGNVNGGRVASKGARKSSSTHVKAKKEDDHKLTITVKDGVARYPVATLLTLSKMDTKGITLNNSSPESISKSAKEIEKTMKKSLTDKEIISLSERILKLRRASAVSNQSVRLETLLQNVRKKYNVPSDQRLPGALSIENAIMTKSYKFSWEK